ncbi:MAG: hypothetical protein WC992_02475 [Acholeplasmataceae bacterium]|jgi:hypothetical protein|nr:hypothetical protein [Acholeplasmataceae bacterium]
MKNDEKDPFAKFDHLFEEDDNKSVVQQKKLEEPGFDDLQTEDEHLSGKYNKNQKTSKAARIIITVAFVVLFFQFIPLAFINSNWNLERITPFMIVIFIIVINVIIKLFKR